MAGPTPWQKIFMPPPVPVDSTTGAREAGAVGELLGDRLGVGEHRRRTDDANLVACLGDGRGGHGQAGECRYGELVVDHGEYLR
jgi:hypothetical protein